MCSICQAFTSPIEYCLKVITGLETGKPDLPETSVESSTRFHFF